MIEERRRQACPKHGTVYICSEHGDIICVAPQCTWRKKSNRLSDKDIPSVSEVKKEWS
jgi:hypothetical protein